MTTEVNSGQVRGPVQLAFAQSIDPIVPLEVSITRMAVTNEKDLEKERTMGRKYIVPYALYRVHGFISANIAAKTGFSGDDLAKLWQALQLMFEHDRSATRGEMAARKLIVFKHDSALGSQPAHKLFDAVKVERVNGESGTPASGFWRLQHQRGFRRPKWCECGRVALKNVQKNDRTFNRNPRGKSGRAPDSPFRPATLRLLPASMRVDS